MFVVCLRVGSNHLRWYHDTSSATAFHSSYPIVQTLDGSLRVAHLGEKKQQQGISYQPSLFNFLFSLLVSSRFVPASSVYREQTTQTTFVAVFS